MKVTAICATSGRHACLERAVGFFLAQTYLDKELLIYNNSSVPLSLAEGYPGIICINAPLDAITGRRYTNLGSIYRDALSFVDSDIVCFWDDDDAYLPDHIEEGVKGLQRAKSLGDYKAYKPKYSWYRDANGIHAMDNTLEPSIFVEYETLKQYGFYQSTSDQHLKWINGLLNNGQIWADPTGTPTLIYDWSQAIPTYKTSGDPSNPSNFNNYQIRSQDHGDWIITSVAPDSYYQEFYTASKAIPYTETTPHMHTEVDQFIGQYATNPDYAHYFNGTKVLEVGSADINGTIRHHFKDCSYLGIDLAEGPGVDLAMPIQQLRMFYTFDVVVSTEMLEHDRGWQEALRAMYHALRPGGLLLITCAGPTRPEHGTSRTTPQDSPHTTDYYGNVSPADILSVLPENLFTMVDGRTVRGDNDTWFAGIKREVVPEKKYDEIVFVTAQPDERAFASEVEVQIHNFRKYGISSRMIVCVYWDKDQGLNSDWITLKHEYQEVEFHFFRSDTDDILPHQLHDYAPIIRPYCLKKLWRKKPELKDKAVFYLDSDVIFIDAPELDKYLADSTSYLTDTRSYLGVDYMKGKAVEIGQDPLLFIQRLCDISGVLVDKFLRGDLKASGGAQYVLKGVTEEFWQKVQEDCITIRSAFRQINRDKFYSIGQAKGQSAEDAGIQSWCADMWAVLMNLYYFNIEFSTPDFMKSIWSENEITRLQGDHLGTRILHNAGGNNVNGVGYMWDKTKFRRKYNGMYAGKWFWEVPEELDKTSQELCSCLYTEAIQRVGRHKGLLGK
jgi:SAM-dependent methyltransferase